MYQHMATSINKIRCATCDKEKATLRCGGCLKEFCHKDLADHRQELHKQLDEIEVNRDLLRLSLNEQIEEPNNHILIQQIDEWEHNSIKKIQETAEEARQTVLKNSNGYIYQIETKLNRLTDQLRQSRYEDDFNEINLRLFQEELKELTNELTKPSNISIREDLTPFISKILVDVFGKCIAPISISKHLELHSIR
jgi:hypothetical protein